MVIDVSSYMSELIITVAGGLLVAIIASALGIGGRTKVTIEAGTRVKRTGKWIMLISGAMIVGGLAWAVSSNSHTQGGLDLNQPGTVYGLTLAAYGLLFYGVGRIVAWFQRP